MPGADFDERVQSAGRDRQAQALLERGARLRGRCDPCGAVRGSVRGEARVSSVEAFEEAKKKFVECRFHSYGSRALGCIVPIDVRKRVPSRPESASGCYPCRLVSTSYQTFSYFHGDNTGSNPVGDANQNKQVTCDIRCSKRSLEASARQRAPAKPAADCYPFSAMGTMHLHSSFFHQGTGKVRRILIVEVTGPGSPI